MSSRVFSSLLVIALASSAAPLHAAGEIAPSASAVAPPPSALPELPRLQPIANPEPDPAALKDLDSLLERLLAADDATRQNARAAIADVIPSIVPAVRHRIQDLRAGIDREALPRLLEDIRKAGRKSLKKPDKPKEKPDKARKDDDPDEGDWLDFALAQPKAKDKNWQDLVRLLAMERILAAVGTTPAVREMIQLHAYFGDLLRVDLQRQIAKLRDKAVPALLEARQHDAKIVQRWANKELDVLGKAIPGEAVGTNDTQILADVLRAYGRTRDVDAVRVILSFCNNDRVQLRDASREAIAAIGEPGIWQLRDQYLGLTGNKPPKDWAWDRIARELFALYDHGRLAELFHLMDDGVAAMAAGKAADAVDAFDKVLARAPLFERKADMVKAYFDRAKQLEGDKRADALDMLHKALRLDPAGPLSKPIGSEASYLEGLDSIDRGAPDKFLFDRAIELDPTNARARDARASLDEKAQGRQTSIKRYAVAIGIGIAALVAMLILATRKASGAATPRPSGS